MFFNHTDVRQLLAQLMSRYYSIGSLWRPSSSSHGYATRNDCGDAALLLLSVATTRLLLRPGIYVRFHSLAFFQIQINSIFSFLAGYHSLLPHYGHFIYTLITLLGFNISIWFCLIAINMLYYWLADKIFTLFSSVNVRCVPLSLLLSCSKNDVLKVALCALPILFYLIIAVDWSRLLHSLFLLYIIVRIPFLVNAYKNGPTHASGCHHYLLIFHSYEFFQWLLA